MPNLVLLAALFVLAMFSDADDGTVLVSTNEGLTISSVGDFVVGEVAVVSTIASLQGVIASLLDENAAHGTEMARALAEVSALHQSINILAVHLLSVQISNQACNISLTSFSSLCSH